jgi:predicted AAA+ superfamily ATPase
MEMQVLKQVILDQQEIRLPDNFVQRFIYDDIVALRKNRQIIVITGIRRCGKSTLLQEIRRQSEEFAYYINFDDDRLVKFQLEDFQTLLELFIELYGLQKTFYFDEIQNIPGWERFVRRLHDQDNKVYITGSNAAMFSEELGTRLTGRYIPIEMYPFSFKEYVNHQQPDLLKVTKLTTIQKGQLKHLFSHFSMYGGIPDFLLYQQESFLQALYKSILYRDIIVRYKVSEKAVKELVFYLASNIGRETTYNSLKTMLGLGSASTVSDYCNYLEESFLCFFINRYAHSLKRQLHYAKKVYFIDQSLVKAVGFRVSQDEGGLLENVVFIELKRRGKEIYFHKEKKECDFLIREGTRIVKAIQVCLQMESEAIKKREIAGLLEAMETYHLEDGCIITGSTQGTETIQHDDKTYTVHIIPVWQWLLD